MTACSPAYELSQRAPAGNTGAGVLRLGNDVGNLGAFVGTKNRDDVLLAALKRFDIDSFDEVQLETDCNANSVVVQKVVCVDDVGLWRQSPSQNHDQATTPPNGCVPMSAGNSSRGGGGALGGSFVPTPVVAIISAAVDESVYWTYQEDTTLYEPNSRHQARLTLGAGKAPTLAPSVCRREG